MPEMSKTLCAALSGAFCLIVLAGMLVRHAWPLMTGEPIFLEVIARDPRDLFRGDYVVLTYPIEQLVVAKRGSATAPSDPNDVPAGVAVEPLGVLWDTIARELADNDSPYDTWNTWRDHVVYVQLRPEPSTAAGVPQVYRAVSVSEVPIPGSANLAGRIRHLSRSQWDDPNSPLTLEMHYGIDALYVQEGTGLRIEEAIRKGQVHAVVSVTSSGSARLSDLIIDGRRWSVIKAGD